MIFRPFFPAVTVSLFLLPLSQKVIAQTAGISSRGKRSAAEQYRNIQVLKEVLADELIPAMQFITYSLGVECSYCHVEGALEKDDKKTKLTARKMMQMMFTINRDSFDSSRW